MFCVLRSSLVTSRLIFFSLVLFCWAAPQAQAQTTYINTLNTYNDVVGVFIRTMGIRIRKILRQLLQPPLPKSN